MNVKIPRSLAALALLLVSLPALAQHIRYEWQGNAYVVAEDQLIAERVVDRVIGASPGADAQLVFFRPVDRAPGDSSLHKGGVAVAELPGGSYYATSVEAGVHTYAVDGQTLSVEVAPGQRRYVKIGNEPTGPRLSSTNALTFLRLVTGKRQPLYLN